MIVKATKLGSCVTNQKVMGFIPVGKRTWIVSSEPPVSPTE